MAQLQKSSSHMNFFLRFVNSERFWSLNPEFFLIHMPILALEHHHKDISNSDMDDSNPTLPSNMSLFLVVLK